MLKPERPTLELKKKKDFNINYFEFTGGWWIHWVCHTTRSSTQKGSQAGFWVFLYGCRLESIFIYQYKDTLNILYMHQKFNFIKVCKLCIFDNTWLNNTLMKVDHVLTCDSRWMLFCLYWWTIFNLPFQGRQGWGSPH